MPRHLADRILASRAAMEGERKLVTVLLADIRGSTALIDGLDAEAAIGRLDPPLRAMIDAVHRFEGTVNRVQGDGVMALFGAPIAHEDHALRACLAASAMRDAIALLDDDAVKVRVGLHSGEVVVRSIRNDLTVEYEAEGPTVHLAARMEQAARPNTIRMTDETMRGVRGFVRARALGASEVRGISEPVEQFELVAIETGASRWEVRARRGLVRFVGRGEEVARLSRRLERAAEGHGQLAAIVGEAGIGKSRLVHELLSSPAASGWTVRVAAGSPISRDTAYAPFRALLRSVSGIGDDDAPGTMRERVRGIVDELGGPAQELVPPLAALLDLAVDDAWAALEPAARHRRIRESIRWLALRRAESGPVLFVFEDLHWFDAESRDLLGALIDALAAARLFVLLTYRPEFRHDWNAKSYFTDVHLEPIGADDSRSLVTEMLGDDPGLAALGEMLAERCVGRPLFIEESVRSLAEQGVLAGAMGAYQPAGDIERIDLPDTVQAVIAARIDRLAPEHKDVLRLAAVIGRIIPFDLLRDVAGVPAGALVPSIAALQAGEFLLEHQTFPTRELIFNHALTENVAYEGMLRSQRQAIHAAIVRAIEELDPARLRERVELLGHHAFRGGLWEKAVGYLRGAGMKAVANAANAEAMRLLERALDALEHHPDTPDRALIGVDVRMELRPALGALGRYREIRERLSEAADLADRSGDARRRALVRADTTHVLYQLGNVQEAVREGEHAIRAARDVEDRGIELQAAANLAMAHMFRAEYAPALELGESIVPALEGEFRDARLGTTGTSSCLWIANVCGMHAMRGDFDRGLEFGEKARVIAAASKREFDRAIFPGWAAFAHARRGDHRAAMAMLEPAIEAARAGPFDFALMWALSTYGHALTLSGRLEEAVDMLQEARDRAESGGLAIPGQMSITGQAWNAIESGDAERADAHARELLDAVGTTGLVWLEPTALRLLGRARMLAGDVTAARAAIEESMELARDQSARPDVAHALLALAEIDARSERRHEADRHLADARELYESMGMTYWRPAIEARLRALGG